MESPIDMCPTLQETESDYLESVGSIGLESNHFGQGRVKVHMQLNDSYLPRMHLKDQQAPRFQQQQQRMPAQGNSPSMEDLMKQLAASNLEFQQTMSSSNMQF
ncbi:hypothetical protein CR513_39240, partial [Mucuna pruriens]